MTPKRGIVIKRMSRDVAIFVPQESSARIILSRGTAEWKDPGGGYRRAAERANEVQGGSALRGIVLEPVLKRRAVFD